jgi:hypothetical protein
MIDGPHGYPFPDMEYCYLYPHVATGGLLLLDDTHIPSIGRMVEIIKAEDMFDLLEVVDNMAFFRRTEAPTLDPLGDNWWLQGYNASLVRRMNGESEPAARPKLGRRIVRAVGRVVPSSVRRQVKTKLRSALYDD